MSPDATRPPIMTDSADPRPDHAELVQAVVSRPCPAVDGGSGGPAVSRHGWRQWWVGRVLPWMTGSGGRCGNWWSLSEQLWGRTKITTSF